MQYPMIKWARDLFPLCRSLTGLGTKKTLKYFKKINPEFRIINFKSGKKVFDWEIPEEWIIKDAYIEHENGKRFAQFKHCNLHLMGYSIAVNKIISKDELIKKIYTLPESPESIPYVTSYYKKDWGFCLSHKEYLNLPDGNYKVFIDSEHKPGTLNLIEAVIPGKTKKELFFSSYLCHPSMANNELSGPVLLNEIMNMVKKNKNRYFTYRFVILPETLGSIAYLSKKYKYLKKQVICGFNLSCVGDERSYSHVSSRLGNNIADKALLSAIEGLENNISYSFLERGSDERQYCSPGIDLPLCTFCRTKFGVYPEYHTSHDNFDVVTSKGLIGSYKVMETIIKAFEVGIYPSVKILGEPQLGKRGLYPNTSVIYKDKHPAQIRMDLLAYCDSLHDIFDISKKIKVNLSITLKEILELKEKNIIKTKF